ncbi:6-phosphofructokinase [Aestuariimicrobium sp. Y1814]|uniref:6-phosphofructokinase n=1 Tax=Aestuariimicrobium sp. Y1814 TaxID=3418742 RepID=UPI003DA773B9
MGHVTEDLSSRPRLGILTSGGDAQGMNAAVRAVVRSALTLGAQVFAIYEGYQGMIDGGDGIREFGWDDVGSILNKGGTVIGTYRSPDFRERDGRRRAARNLVERGIDHLVVIGGDGSLSGLDLFRQEWPELLAELVEAGDLSQHQVEAHPSLKIAGLVGSIDNDLVGTDMTIGADTALHRIVDAIDSLTSTAASHQRRFVVEVMGRHCGYLALMAAIAGGCDYVFIPENPPAEGWEVSMCEGLRKGRAAGRRDSIVLVAEGARDLAGEPITGQRVADAIQEQTGEDARVTILGHVQRGGAPSAYDRWCSTWLGYEAARTVLEATPTSEAKVLGIGGNRVKTLSLQKSVADTRRVPDLIKAGDYTGAMALRGSSFATCAQIHSELISTKITEAAPGSKRIAILHAGGLAPGMNTAVRAAVRLGISRGFTMLGVRNGYEGLRKGDIQEMTWREVEGLSGEGGSVLGTRRTVPTVEEMYAINRALEDHQVDALLVIGGFNAYEGAWQLHNERSRYPAFNLPIVCIPTSIDNNLPGSELSIGTDSALNAIVDSMDKIKMSGSAAQRCFVVETMGRYCGYLAMMGGLASGAERVYLHEEGITLDALTADVHWLKDEFENGRRLFLAVRNENANEHFTTDFLTRLLEEAGGDAYDVRQSILGHIQQGANPSPFDRLLATRLVSRGIDILSEELASSEPAESWYIGQVSTGIEKAPLQHMHDLLDPKFRRPKKQWWMALRQVHEAVSEGPAK